MSFGPKGLGGLIFALIAGAAALHFTYGLGTMAWLSVTGISVEGKVTAFVSYPSNGKSRGGTRIQVTFKDQKGQGQMVEARFGRGNGMSAKPRTTHQLGENVRVLYPRDKPEAAIIADPVTIAWHIVVSLLSAAFALVGLWIIRADVRQQREDGWTPRRF